MQFFQIFYLLAFSILDIYINRSLSLYTLLCSHTSGHLSLVTLEFDP